MNEHPIVNNCAVTVFTAVPRGLGHEAVAASVATNELIQRLVERDDTRAMVLKALLDFERQRAKAQPDWTHISV